MNGAFCCFSVLSLEETAGAWLQNLMPENNDISQEGGSTLQLQGSAVGLQALFPRCVHRELDLDLQHLQKVGGLRLQAEEGAWGTGRLPEQGYPSAWKLISHLMLLKCSCGQRAAQLLRLQRCGNWDSSCWATVTPGVSGVTPGLNMAHECFMASFMAETSLVHGRSVINSALAMLWGWSLRG